VTFRALHTTRSRLTGSQFPFTLERDSASHFGVQSGKGMIQQIGDSIKLESTLELDYWEVDPAWDGKTFRSAAQAVRPVRSALVPRELKIKTGRDVCVRLVTVQGEQFQLP